jgi:hypothetical protein
MVALLAAFSGFGGAFGYDHYLASKPSVPATQLIVQSDPQLHADLIALHETMLESLRLNQEAWSQQMAERAARQSQINRWNSDLHEFNQKVK